MSSDEENATHTTLTIYEDLLLEQAAHGELGQNHDDLLDHCDLIKAQLEQAKLENAELKAAAAQQMAPLLNLGGHNVLELNKRLRTQLEAAKAKHEKNIAELHACRFDSEKIILASNKALQVKVELLTARLALTEQQHDAAQESPEPAPAPESQDAGAPFPPGCRPIW